MSEKVEQTFQTSKSTHNGKPSKCATVEVACQNFVVNTTAPTDSDNNIKTIDKYENDLEIDQINIDVAYL